MFAVGAVILVSLLFYIISSNHIDISNIKFKVFKTQLNNDVSQFKNKINLENKQFYTKNETDNLLIKNDIISIKYNIVELEKDMIITNNKLDKLNDVLLVNKNNNNNTLNDNLMNNIKEDLINVKTSIIDVKQEQSALGLKLNQIEGTINTNQTEVLNIKNELKPLKIIEGDLALKSEVITLDNKLDQVQLTYSKQLRESFSAYDSRNLSNINQKLLNLSNKLEDSITSSSLSEAFVTKFANTTVKFINSFTTDVINAVERAENLTTPPATPRERFSNNLKSSLDLYNHELGNIASTDDTPLNSTKVSLEYSSIDTPLDSTKVSQEIKTPNNN